MDEEPKSIQRDRPWIFRTYAGHSTAEASNKLYRDNLEKGQTGLSIAFDLPTQTALDADHTLSIGEVGKVGVPISHIGDMRALMDGIPLDKMNTSMTINATAPWLLALYIAVADEQGVERSVLTGTTQNDIIKEYLSRGTYVYPPGPSMRLIKDMITFTFAEMPKWNPINICSYHLQEAGATPVQELSFALANAISVLDTVKASGEIAGEDFPRVVGRISFFVNAGVRFITEICKMRAFVQLWDEICRERYGVEDPKFRRFRYGVQVNSLGLTEQQPENNVYRILLEMLAVVLSKDARARAVQLPAWNEAYGLPKPWDQQWSIRMQQIVAYESDLLEYGDIFNGSVEIERKVNELCEAARTELAHIDEMGGAVEAVKTSYMKQQLVDSNAKRLAAIEAGEQIVVGVNAWTASENSPLFAQGNEGVVTKVQGSEAGQVEKLKQWRAKRNEDRVAAALEDLRNAAQNSENIMPPSIAAAKAGVTTGEWGQVLRDVYGEFRAPTGIGAQISSSDNNEVNQVRQAVEKLSQKRGRRLKILVGKPGLDGHSNGAEQIAVRARDCGLDVIYDGIRFTPADLVKSAVEENVDVVGLSVLSGSHLPLVGEIIEGMSKAGLEDIPVVVGGIIPPEDAFNLKSKGVAAIYTPKDFQLTEIMSDIVALVEARAGLD